jgi:hypothetical protein
VKAIYTFLALLFSFQVPAQTVLHGRVTDQKGHALPGANVFLRGTFDGANTDSTGTFRFTASRRDTATLFVSYLGYESFSQKVTLSQTPSLTIRLTEMANELNTVGRSKHSPPPMRNKLSLILSR